MAEEEERRRRRGGGGGSFFCLGMNGDSSDQVCDVVYVATLTVTLLLELTMH